MWTSGKIEYHEFLLFYCCNRYKQYSVIARDARQKRVELGLEARTELTALRLGLVVVLLLAVAGNRPLSKTKEIALCHHC